MSVNKYSKDNFDYGKLKGADDFLNSGTGDTILQGLSTFNTLSNKSTGEPGKGIFLQMNQRNYGKDLWGTAGKATDAVAQVMTAIDNLTTKSRPSLAETIGYAYGGNLYDSGGWMNVGTTSAALLGNALQNSQIRDTTDAIQGINNAQMGNQSLNDSYDSLMNDYSNLKTLNHVSAEDLRNKSVFGDIANSLSAGAQGSAAGGTVGGPWGAAIGGIAGTATSLIGSIFGRNKAKKQARKLNNRIDFVNEFNQNSLENRLNNLNYKTFSTMDSNYSAFGGPLQDNLPMFAYGGGLSTNGANFSDGIIDVNAGGTHEQNPNNGVPMGADENGNPNLVEQGEAIWNDYVFSNRLQVPDDIRKQYKLKGKKGMTYADAVRNLQKDSKERPNDAITKRGLDSTLTRLARAQEIDRKKQQAADALTQAAVNYFAIGGALDNEFLRVRTNAPVGPYNPLTGFVSRWGNTSKAATSNANNTEYSAGTLPEVTVYRKTTRSNSSTRHKSRATVRSHRTAVTHNTQTTPASTTTPDISNLLANIQNPTALVPPINMPNIYGNNSNTEVVTNGQPNSQTTTSSPTKAQHNQKYLFGSINEVLKNREYVNSKASGYLPYNKTLTKEEQEKLKKGTLYKDPQFGGMGDYDIFTTFVMNNRNSPYVLSYLKELDEAAGGNHLFDKKGNLKKDAFDYWYKQRTTGPWGKYHETPLPTPIGPAPLFNAIPAQGTKEFNTLNSAVTKGMQKIAKSGNAGNVDDTTINPKWIENLRYAPAIGAGIGVLGDLLGVTNVPDYTNANMVLNSAKGLGNVAFSPIGDYMKPELFDRDYYANQLTAAANSSRNAIINNSGLNRGTATAGILAADRNYNDSLGKLYRQGEEFNAAQREKALTFNRGTNMFNSENDLKAQQINSSIRNTQLNATLAAARMREEALARAGAARSANMTNLFNSLGNIGVDEINRRDARWAISKGIFGSLGYGDWRNLGLNAAQARAIYMAQGNSDTATTAAENAYNQKACGGKLNKKKKKGLTI